jgi:peroxiredoxin
MKTTYTFLTIALMVVLGTGFIGIQAGEHGDGPISGKAPDFTLKDINGNDVKLSQFAGKIVVLEWVNYDCPFVKAHYNDDVHTMKDLAGEYADDDVVWLTINSTHYATAESNKKWADGQDIQHQHLLIDSDGTVGKLYHAKATPHMFIVHKNGHIVYQGAIDNAPLGRKVEDYVNYVDKALMQLLAGEDVTQSQTKPYGCSVKYPPENKP